MKSVYLSLCCFWAVCSGCTGRSVSEEELFSEKQPLAGRVWLADEALLDPDGLLITDSLLLLSNKNDSLYLEAFRLSDGEPLGRFLSKGSGPEEFIFLTSMQWNVEDRAVYVSDFGSHKLFRYEEEDVLHGRPAPQPVSLPARSQEEGGTQLTHYWWSPYGIVAQNLTDMGRVCLFTPDSLIFGGAYPAPEKGRSPVSRVSVGQYPALPIVCNPFSGWR